MISRGRRHVIQKHKETQRSPRCDQHPSWGYAQQSLTPSGKLIEAIFGAFQQAFRLNGIIQEGEESDLEEKPSHEGWVSVSFSKEDKARMRASWSSTIIVKTYGRNIGFSFLSSRICSLWNPSSELDCIDLGHDYFLIKFDCPQDLDKVLKCGPWFIGQQFLAIRLQELEFKASNALFSSMAVCIRLPKLPIEFYEPSSLLKIGQEIGPILPIDSHTTSSVKGHFTRLCVQVNLDKPLINTIHIGKMNQVVQYEGLNSLCFTYQSHHKESCPYLIREKLVQDSQKVMPESVPPSPESLEAKSGSTFEDKTCGEWMVVSRRKGRARHGNPSLSLEKSSSRDVTSEGKAGELASDA